METHNFAGNYDNNYAIISIAISLKRIADALDKHAPITYASNQSHEDNLDAGMDEYIVTRDPKEHSSRDDLK